MLTKNFARLFALTLCALIWGATLPSHAQSPSPEDEISTATLDRDLISRLIREYTNEEREKQGLKSVEPADPLQRLAREHSEDMAKRGYFSHESQREQDPDISFGERVDLRELGYRSTGENISLQPIVKSREIRTTISPSGDRDRDVTRNFATYKVLARDTVDGWMKSPGHRKNILNGNFNLIGIGVAPGLRKGSPYLWITQDFAQK